MGVDAGRPGQDRRERADAGRSQQDRRERADAGRSQQDQRDRRRGSTNRSVPVLGYVIGGALLVGYFVWMCSEMASHASNGMSVPISIFGGVLIGVLAGAAGLITKGRGS